MTKKKSKRLLSWLLSIAMVCTLFVTPVYAGTTDSDDATSTTASDTETVADETEDQNSGIAIISEDATIEETDNEGNGNVSVASDEENDADKETDEDETEDTSWYNTTSTSFTISDAADLAGFAAIVNGTAKDSDGVSIAADSFSGKTVTLNANIDLNSTSLCIASDSSHMFAGTFDGGGYTISNMSCQLFGYVSAGATIKDVTLNINSSSTYAGLAGIVYGSEDSLTTISGVTVTGTMTGASAGLIAYAYSSGTATSGVVKDTEILIQNCTNAADITTTNTSGIGGIVNLNSGTSVYFLNCTNTGTLTATADSSGTKEVHIGGIVRYVNGGTAGTYKTTLEGCVNSGVITTAQNGSDKRTNVGGMISTAQGGVFEFFNCSNSGAISGTINNSGSGSACVGGLAGKWNGYTCTATGFTNTGDITATGSGSSNSAYAGGIIGYTDNGSMAHTIKGTVSGTIKATANSTGMAGYAIGYISKSNSTTTLAVNYTGTDEDLPIVGGMKAGTTLNYDAAIIYDKDGSYVASYTSLSDAFAGTTDGCTIVLVSDVSVTNAVYNGDGYFQVSGKNVTLDLNEYKLSVDTTRILGVKNGGTLNVKNGTIEIADGTTSSYTQFNMVRGNSKFTATNVTFDANSIGTYAVYIASGAVATVEMTKCTFTDLKSAVVFDADNASTVTLTGCSYEKQPFSTSSYNTIENYTVVIDENSPSDSGYEYNNGYTLFFNYVVADGGTISSESTVVVNSYFSAASLTVKEGGTVTADVKVNDDTCMTVEGGTVTGTITVVKESDTEEAAAVSEDGEDEESDESDYTITGGLLTISGGTIIGQVKSSGTLIMTGGTVKDDGETGYSDGVVYILNGNVYISGGTVTGTKRGFGFAGSETIGGTITGGMISGSDIALMVRANESNTVKISGGSYTATNALYLANESDESTIFADGYSAYNTEGTALSSTSSGTVTLYKSTLSDKTVIVTAKDAVALNTASDGTKTLYTTLAAAVTAASSGDTVTLLADITSSTSITISTSLTIDFNGYDYEYTGSTYGAFYTANEATVIFSNSAGSDDVSTVKVSSGLALPVLSVNPGTTVTVNANVTLESSGYYPTVFVGESTESSSSVATLNVYGSITHTGTGNNRHFAIQGNGSDQTGGTVINIYNGAVVSSGRSAIYHPQYGTLNIYGGTVTGYCAIGISSGTLNISGGTITGTANDNDLSDTYSDDGLHYDGSAIVLASSYGNVTVNITGGTIESYYSYAIRSYYRTGSSTTTSLAISSDAVVKSATASGATATTSDIYIPSDYLTYITAAVSGGSFSKEVSADNCADGYVPTSNTDEDGNVTSYGVTKFYLGISTDSDGTEESVPASVDSGYGESVMYVKVSGDYIGTNGYYSTSAYPTTSLTYTPDIDSNDSGSYIFAGWYSASTDDDGNTTYTAMTSFPTGDAYAKFVDADVLTVKGIVTYGLASDGDEGTNYWRFATGLDSFNYNYIGFQVKFGDATDATELVGKVYTKYTVTSAGNYVFRPSMFGSSTNIATNVISDTSATTCTVRAYWTTMDGTSVYSGWYSYSIPTSGCELTETSAEE